MRTTPEKITELSDNEVFVFGSNLSGYHGGGAAKLAHEKFGAVWGEGIGLHGNTYAIPTLGTTLEKLELDVIGQHINQFIIIAQYYPSKTFLVTEIGCGIAGFAPEEIAPYFKYAMNEPNIILPERFIEVINP